MAFAGPALFLRFAKTPMRLLDAMRPSAYAIFLLHYLFIMYLQYAVYEPALPAFVKFAIVFIGTLSLSWATTLALRRIPFVARMI
jgi:surface polysaccharide O-acyltransferase-like enzyme